MRRTTALIIGGGPAGSAASIILARGGVAAHVIERTPAPHDVVCGGFLGWDSIAALKRLGVDAFALGAQPISCLRLISGTREVETELPKPAAGLSRRILDEALLAASSDAGATIARGRAVRLVNPASSSVRLDDGTQITGDGLFIATGKHDVRGVERAAGPSDLRAVGLRTALETRAATRGLCGKIELHLFDRGYAGLLMQEDGRANLCISVTKDRLLRAKSSAALVAELAIEAPLLGMRLAGGGGEAWQAIAGVPYGWFARDTMSGLFRLGDQGAVISSIAGDGVAIALASGTAAAQAFLDNGPAAAAGYQSSLARSARLPLKVSDLLRHAAERRATRSILMRAAATPGLASLAAHLTRIG